MKVYVVRGRHGELYVSGDSEVAFTLWAETNGFNNYPDFLDEYIDDIEISEGHWFLDECGDITLVEVQ